MPRLTDPQRRVLRVLAEGGRIREYTERRPEGFRISFSLLNFDGHKLLAFSSSLKGFLRLDYTVAGREDADENESVRFHTINAAGRRLLEEADAH